MTVPVMMTHGEKVISTLIFKESIKKYPDDFREWRCVST